ncbi:MAG: rubrerythrin family protein [Deltaproteobacteria bacterium]|nr:rubrerythrin family protein [Deltaproteobacteria bacterium]
MADPFLKLIEEAIYLEWNIGKLYTLFHSMFPEDAEFWWLLALEEKNHAALIRSGLEYFTTGNYFPASLVDMNMEGLKVANQKVLSWLREFEENPPTRKAAFEIGLEIENFAGELHFQNYVESQGSSRIDLIFKELNRHDKDHAKRIRLYMDKVGYDCI